jgi:hypothetical protein
MQNIKDQSQKIWPIGRLESKPETWLQSWRPKPMTPRHQLLETLVLFPQFLFQTLSLGCCEYLWIIPCPAYSYTDALGNFRAHKLETLHPYPLSPPPVSPPLQHAPIPTRQSSGAQCLRAAQGCWIKMNGTSWGFLCGDSSLNTSFSEHILCPRQDLKGIWPAWFA